MAKKYFDNHKLQIAYDYYFSNIECDTWENIHSVLNITSGDNLPKRKMIEGKYQVYGGGGITNNSHNEFNIDYETIGIGRVGARCGCVFNIKKNSWVTDNALLVQSFDDKLSLNFLKHFLNYQNLGQFANNAMQPVISKTRISSIKLPIINLGEQNKIANNLDILENNTEDYKDLDNDLLSKISVVDKWKELTIEVQTQKQLLDDLKQAILEEAIQGKLTQEWREQNPNTEPASELVEHIKSEKEQLIKGKKIKKEKPLPPITEEEIPFELPEGWVWCRFLDTSIIVRGGSPRPIGNYITNDTDGINWIKIGDTKNDSKYITRTKQKIRKEGLKKSRYVEPGDFLLTNSMSFGRPYIMKTFGCIHDGWLLIRNPKTIINDDYLYSLLSSSFMYNSFKESASGGVVQNLNIDKVKNSLIPIPPLKEQLIIAKKIDVLMQKYNELEQEITQSEQQANMLMQAVLKEAFESKTENTEEYANA